jgi:hypothetical protein
MLIILLPLAYVTFGAGFWAGAWSVRDSGYSSDFNWTELIGAFFFALIGWPLLIACLWNADE